MTCLMAQCGLHIPCGEAQICMNRNILCDIGDGQNLAENLSTFSAHIVNVLEILRKVTPESLVVMDELGSGTDPAEGMGIAIAILEELKKSGALFLVTTHYPEVKTYAEQERSIVNARMTFDKENLKPLYQMVIGEAGESCAFYIAGRLGMPASMLRRAAREAYGEGALSPGECSPGACSPEECSPGAKRDGGGQHRRERKRSTWGRNPGFPDRKDRHGAFQRGISGGRAEKGSSPAPSAGPDRDSEKTRRPVPERGQRDGISRQENRHCVRTRKRQRGAPCTAPRQKDLDQPQTCQAACGGTGAVS